MRLCGPAFFEKPFEAAMTPFVPEPRLPSVWRKKRPRKAAEITGVLASRHHPNGAPIDKSWCFC